MGGKNAVRIVALILIVVGILALAYGGFSYTKETHEAQVGTLTLQVKEKQTINIPIWAGVAGIVIGGVLLLFGVKKS